jgi:uncharacterized membrane protein YfcA
VPFISIAVGPAAAVPTINLLAGGLNAVMLVAERAQTRWRDVALLLAPAAITIPIVGVLIKRLDTDTLSVINGVAILLGAAFLAKGLRVHSLRGRRGALLAGALSGAGNVATSVGGPPVAMYAVNAEWPAASYRPTVQAFFLGINVMSVAVRGWPRLDHPWMLPVFVVAMLGGWFVGARAARRIDDQVVRNLLLIVAAVGGLVAVIRGLV